ncbi:hypothetical protein ACH4SP_14545 [Streptomyces sp. NPDC021093]|uniref:hypothetical protein n=1 Tax=Streptomyces sp. NPDC021093 TaxID=3365112 RepID=UPI00378C1350
MLLSALGLLLITLPLTAGGKHGWPAWLAMSMVRRYGRTVLQAGALLADLALNKVPHHDAGSAFGDVPALPTNPLQLRCEGLTNRLRHRPGRRSGPG